MKVSNKGQMSLIAALSAAAKEVKVSKPGKDKAGRVGACLAPDDDDDDDDVDGEEEAFSAEDGDVWYKF